MPGILLRPVDSRIALDSSVDTQTRSNRPPAVNRKPAEGKVSVQGLDRMEGDNPVLSGPSVLQQTAAAALAVAGPPTARQKVKWARKTKRTSAVPPPNPTERGLLSEDESLSKCSVRAVNGFAETTPVKRAAASTNLSVEPALEVLVSAVQPTAVDSAPITTTSVDQQQPDEWDQMLQEEYQQVQPLMGDCPFPPLIQLLNSSGLHAPDGELDNSDSLGPRILKSVISMPEFPSTPPPKTQRNLGSTDAAPELTMDSFTRERSGEAGKGFSLGGEVNLTLWELTPPQKVAGEPMVGSRPISPMISATATATPSTTSGAAPLGLQRKMPRVASLDEDALVTVHPRQASSLALTPVSQSGSTSHHADPSSPESAAAIAVAARRTSGRTPNRHSEGRIEAVPFVGQPALFADIDPSLPLHDKLSILVQRGDVIAPTNAQNHTNATKEHNGVQVQAALPRGSAHPQRAHRMDVSEVGNGQTEMSSRARPMTQWSTVSNYATTCGGGTVAPGHGTEVSSQLRHEPRQPTSEHQKGVLTEEALKELNDCNLKRSKEERQRRKANLAAGGARPAALPATHTREPPTTRFVAPHEVSGGAVNAGGVMLLPTVAPVHQPSKVDPMHLVVVRGSNPIDSGAIPHNSVLLPPHAQDAVAPYLGTIPAYPPRVQSRSSTFTHHYGVPNSAATALHPLQIIAPIHSSEANPQLDGSARQSTTSKESLSSISALSEYQKRLGGSTTAAGPGLSFTQAPDAIPAPLHLRAPREKSVPRFVAISHE